MNILYTPAIDMIIFALVAYAIAYYLYIRIFKKDFSAHWLPYYLFISGLVEIALLLVYKRITGITWKQIGGGIK